MCDVRNCSYWQVFTYVIMVLCIEVHMQPLIICEGGGGLHHTGMISLDSRPEGYNFTHIIDDNLLLIFTSSSDGATFIIHMESCFYPNTHYLLVSV